MSSDPEAVVEATGREAVGWFIAAFPNEAGTVFDNSLIAIAAAFGPNREIAVRAVARPGDDRPHDLFLSVLGNVRDESDWDRLVNAHRTLLEMEQNRLGRTGSEQTDALQRFHLVLERRLQDALPYGAAVDRWFRLS